MQDLIPIQSKHNGRIYWVLPSAAEKQTRPDGNFVKVDRLKAEALRNASVVYGQ